jgi:hypothetical protein
MANHKMLGRHSMAEKRAENLFAKAENDQRAKAYADDQLQ